MKQYQATIIGDRYPMKFSTEASSWHTAAARVVKQYQQRFKGSRTNTITIKMVRIDQSTQL